MSFYSPKVMDHFEHPRNAGKMESPDGVGIVGNTVCGDVMKLYIRVRDDILTDVTFQTFGCGAAIATSSMLTELVKGKPLAEALKFSNRAIIDALEGLPSEKIHCSVLAEQALKAAIDDYYQKRAGRKTGHDSG